MNKCMKIGDNVDILVGVFADSSGDSFGKWLWNDSNDEWRCCGATANDSGSVSHVIDFRKPHPLWPRPCVPYRFNSGRTHRSASRSPTTAQSTLAPSLFASSASFAYQVPYLHT